MFMLTARLQRLHAKTTNRLAEDVRTRSSENGPGTYWSSGEGDTRRSQMQQAHPKEATQFGRITKSASFQNHLSLALHVAGR